MLNLAFKPSEAREAASADAASVELANEVEVGEPALALRRSPNASGDEAKEEVGAEVSTGPRMLDIVRTSRDSLSLSEGVQHSKVILREAERGASRAECQPDIWLAL